MLDHRHWKPEAVLRLIMGLLVVLMTSGLILKYFGIGAEDQAMRYEDFMLGNIIFYAAFLVLVHFFLREHRVGWAEVYGLKGPVASRAVLVGIFIGLIVLPVALLLNHISALLLETIHIEPQRQQAVETFIQTVTLDQRISFGLMAVVSAPLVEELFFRGIMYVTVRQLGYPRLALWGVSIFFAITHANLMTFIPLTFLAIVLTLLYERTHNLLSPICAHIVFNATNLFFMLLEPQPPPVPGS